MNLKFSVGLDVSSKKVDFCISTIDHYQRVKVKSTGSIENTKSGFSKLLKSIKRWTEKEAVPVVVCMEATGVYHENLAYSLDGAGFYVSIVLPNKAKKYLQSLGLKSKNDTIDAKGLAQMGAEQNLERWIRPAKVYVDLKALTRQYQTIREMITSEINRLHAEMHSADSSKVVIKQIKSHIDYLEKQAKQMLTAIDKTIESDQELNKKINNICTVRGLSTLSVATVIADSNGFQLIENYKQLVSYAGYDVVENQSGSHRGKTRISKKGNSRIRRILHMPSLTAIKSEGTVFKDLYERVYERTGIKMKGLVAAQKKLLLTIYHLWRSNKPFDPNYHQKTKANIQKEEQERTSKHVSEREIEKIAKQTVWLHKVNIQ
ncbi:MAG: IS110 family transposase [Cytophagales bacterium]